jgi:hypothetical protein
MNDSLNINDNDEPKIDVTNYMHTLPFDNKDDPANDHMMIYSSNDQSLTDLHIHPHHDQICDNFHINETMLNDSMENDNDELDNICLFVTT